MDHYGCRYKGLMEQGSTCHLNSVLQVLFMTKEFREAVERNNSDDESLDFHLKNLFTDLKQQTGDTKHITEKLGITSERKQCDAAECLQNILRSLTDSVASQLFKGVIMRKNKCSKCTKETGTSEQFWSLPLELVDSFQDYSVADGIIKYFSESNVSGQDQLFCVDCNSKSDSTDKLEIQHHPEVLTLELKRYKFNYILKEDAKITCMVQIPMFLQIPSTGDQSQRYEVYACVELFGDRKRNGIYTVNIKSQDDDKWYHFNGISVRPSWPQPFQRSEEEKNKNACLLFYRKIPAPNIKEASTSGDVETEKTAKNEMDVETKEQSGSEAATQEPDEQDKTSLIPGFKYKGLLNQGSTCYLNSVLQVLFMTREFREAVERYNNEDDSPDFHLKSLFMDLKKNTGDTKHITKKLDITSGTLKISFMLTSYWFARGLNGCFFATLCFLRRSFFLTLHCGAHGEV
ncbi:ubiquitin carboxyl-terminal hydrolase 21-like [Nothobranchius furzeri]|uniref:Ubiquitin carboxyl-terminal hydrolase 21-like n=1 Tax=Nothobranchius furzeri TaxID=105023 RepID=A0A9D2Z094_NOTFU|nr:ubiquitin carboxyl-terminal hydrolase 21-like [Nothobranchius furzeri]